MFTVLFDLDGTLLDSEKIAMESRNRGFLSIFGRNVTKEEENFFIGKPVGKVLAEWFPEHANKLSTEIRSHYKLLASSILPYEGIPEMLSLLREQGYRLGIVSSKRNDNIERELKITGLASFFDVVIGQDDTEKHKPDPEPLILAMSLLNISPETSIYVGDQPTDIVAAQRAGMKHIAAIWGEGTLERFQKGIATYIAHTPNDVVHCILDMEMKQDLSDS